MPELGSGDVVVHFNGTGIDLHSQHPFQVDMVYDGTVLHTTITDTVTLATANQSYVVDIPSQVGDGMAYVGFTAATGGFIAVQEVLDWTFGSAESTPNYYRVLFDADDPIRIETATPAGGPGQFVNDLDPKVELYDPTGALVARDDNGAPDGRNALVRHTALLAGAYTVRVTGVNATRGEFALGVALDQPPAANVDTYIVTQSGN